MSTNTYSRGVGGQVRLLLASAALAVALLACTLPGTGGTTTGNTNPPPQFSPAVSSGQLIVQTISQFCDAVHTTNYGLAYTFLSTAYKRTITSPSQIPDIVPRQKFLNCAEGLGGNFLRVTGNQATDDITYTIMLDQLGSLAQAPGTMNFVQEGSAWKVDAIVISY